VSYDDDDEKDIDGKLFKRRTKDA
jgi:hypothetical protein